MYRDLNLLEVKWAGSLYCNRVENCIAGAQWYCNTVGYSGWKDCIAIGWVGWQLYCNTIMTKRSRLGAVSRHSAQPAPTTQPLGPRYDRGKVQRGAGQGVLGTARRGVRVSAATRQPARCDKAMQACDTTGVSATTRCYTALGGATTQPCARAWARLCAPGCAARPTGCALGALSLFLTQFDSVLFLSQFLDTVSEPGS